MWDTKTVNTIPAIADGFNITIQIAQTIAWASYLTKAGFDQNASKAAKYATYATYFMCSFFMTNLALLPSWVTFSSFLLSYPLVFFVNFVIDNPARRAKKQKLPVTNNFYYLYVVTSTTGLVAYIINSSKSAVLESGRGATSASLLVNMLGIVFTFLFESLTLKASSPGKNGPFLFPFYFGLDL